MFLKYEPEDFPDVENMKCERTTMRFPGSDPTQIQPDLGVWHLLIAWVCRQPDDGKLACFAKTPSDPLVKVLVTPSLHELLIGEGLDSMEGLLTNLEGFWLVVAAVLGEEEEGSLEGFGMLAEVVGVNLEAWFGTGVSSKLLLVSRLLPRRLRSLQSLTTSVSPSASTLRVLCNLPLHLPPERSAPLSVEVSALDKIARLSTRSL